MFLVGCGSKVVDTDAMYRATMRTYTVGGHTYQPQSVIKGQTEVGIASWYGPDFHDRLTSNGERYDMNEFTAAHKTMPMNTLVEVTNLENGKKVEVRINDRGPFVNGRVIDLSKAAGIEIDMHKHGTARVKLRVVGFYSSKAKNAQPVIVRKKSDEKVMVNSSPSKSVSKAIDSNLVLKNSAESTASSVNSGDTIKARRVTPVTRSEENPPVAVPAATEASEKSEFHVQVGYFDNLQSAKNLQQSAAVASHRSIVKKYKNGIYRVFAIFDTQEQARAFINSGAVKGAFLYKN